LHFARSGVEQPLLHAMLALLVQREEVRPMKTRSAAVCAVAIAALTAGVAFLRPSPVAAQMPIPRLVVPGNPLVWDPNTTQTLPITSCIIISITYKGPGLPQDQQLVMGLKCIGANNQVSVFLPDAASAQLAETNFAAQAARPPGQGGVQITATHAPGQYYSLTWMEAF
jgi:hypothetical protein